MKICLDHWDALSKAIDAENLSHLIESKDEIEGVLKEGKEPNDPLWRAHIAVVNNTLLNIGHAANSASVRYLLQDDETHPRDRVKGYGAPHDGRLWPPSLPYLLSQSGPRADLQRREMQARQDEGLRFLYQGGGEGTGCEDSQRTFLAP